MSTVVVYTRPFGHYEVYGEAICAGDEIIAVVLDESMAGVVEDAILKELRDRKSNGEPSE